MVWVTSTFNSRFDGASAFNLDVFNWNTGKVTNIYYIFCDSGFKRTLCGGKWQSSPGGNNYLTSTGRLGCCSPGTFMSNPFVDFSEAVSCTACPSNALTTIDNDDITCTNNVCPTGMVYLDTFYGCVKKLPNGDGADSLTGNAGTLRRAVSDWLDVGTPRNTVVATYGPIEDWDVSEVTNMAWVFYNFRTFNADLSKWNTGAVTTMQGSKYSLSSLSPSAVVSFEYTTTRGSSDHNSHTFCYFCL